jgi:hypothetical protein
LGTGNPRQFRQFCALPRFNLVVIPVPVLGHFDGRCGKIGATMLLEIWERLRGYDKWIETQADIESSSVAETRITGRYGKIVDYSYTSGDMLTWVDGQGEKQYADFTVPHDSPLYQLVGGETVTIRYDPARPFLFSRTSPHQDSHGRQGYPWHPYPSGRSRRRAFLADRNHRRSEALLSRARLRRGT